MRLGMVIGLVAGCGGGATTAVGHAPVPQAARMTVSSLARFASHDAFCAPAPADQDGCEHVCVDPPVAWRATSPTFSAIELWAQTERCPNAAAPPPITCVLALAHGGAWFTSPGITCQRTGMSTMVDRMRLLPIVSRRGFEVFEYAVEGRLLSMDAGPNGERIDGSRPHDRHELLACGLGPSGTPSCTAPIVVGGHDLEDRAMTRAWSIEGDQLVLAPTPEDLEASGDRTAAGGRFTLAFP